MEDLQKQLEALQQRSLDDHRELERLLTAQAAPTFVVQRERKLRRFSGTEDPLLSDWAEEARSCILAQKLSGEAAANFLLSYLDGAAPTGGPLSAQRGEKGCRQYSGSTGGCVWR